MRGCIEKPGESYAKVTIAGRAFYGRYISILGGGPDLRNRYRKQLESRRALELVSAGELAGRDAGCLRVAAGVRIFPNLVRHGPAKDHARRFVQSRPAANLGQDRRGPRYRHGAGGGRQWRQGQLAVLLQGFSLKWRRQHKDGLMEAGTLQAGLLPLSSV